MEGNSIACWKHKQNKIKNCHFFVARSKHYVTTNVIKIKIFMLISLSSIWNKCVQTLLFSSEKRHKRPCWRKQSFEVYNNVQTMWISKLVDRISAMWTLNNLWDVFQKAKVLFHVWYLHHGDGKNILNTNIPFGCKETCHKPQIFAPVLTYHTVLSSLLFV